MSAVLKQKTAEPILTGDLNERFYKAVHEEPALFYDVVQTGVTQAAMPYEIVLLHGGNIDDDALGKMMGLQDKISLHQGPSAENVIDYKTEEEVIDHYSSGGLGFGVFAVNGDLMGQIMLSFDNEAGEAFIKWLMVDGEHRGSQLCEKLLGLALQMAESSGMEKINASVRTHNKKGMQKFSEHGFTPCSIGNNAKDGSSHLTFSKGLAGPAKEPDIPTGQPVTNKFQPMTM